MNRKYPLRVLPLLLAAAFSAHADDNFNEEGGFAAVLPTVVVEGQSEQSRTKGYVDYGEAAVTRNRQAAKDIPQSIDILNIQKNKNYGTNDLSSILEGNAGIDASYDMRGESIYLRGFQADANDIYRDGVRESGQVRRSTANIERVEILKGPASVLYGRTSGGGVINMVSKYAQFKTARSVGVSYSSYAARSLNADINQVISPNVAVRITGEYGRANSFRSGIAQENLMLSPSISVKTDGGLKWTGQYTYDLVERIPDRGPTRTEYDRMGISYRKGFAHPRDTVSDELQVWRSNLEYAFNPDWHLQWQLSHRRANQDFDHFYGGTYNLRTRLLSRTYAWQTTSNRTLTNQITLNGGFQTGPVAHKLTVGLDYSREKRQPTLSFNGRFLTNINPYADAGSWRPSGRLQPVTTRNRHQADSWGLFVQDVMEFTPQLKVSVGGRFDRFRFQSTDILNHSNRYSGSTFSPNLGVVWEALSGHNFYAGFNKGYAPYGGRGYLGINTTGDPAAFDSKPQNFRQYEAGVKSSWLDNRLSTTLSVYQLERYNIRYQPDAVNDPFNWQVRGKERSRGMELNAIGSIVPKLYLRASLGAMQAKIVKDDQSPATVGRHLSNTSSFTGNVFLRYTPTERLYGEIGVTGSGRRYQYDRNGAAQHLPGFARVDALGGWTNQKVSVTLGVHNLFNQKYWRSTAMPAAPRSLTARLTYAF